MSTWNKLVFKTKLHCRINLTLSSLHIVFWWFAWWLVVFNLWCQMVVSTKLFLYCGPSPPTNHPRDPPTPHIRKCSAYLNIFYAGSNTLMSTEKEYFTGLTSRSQIQNWCQYLLRLLGLVIFIESCPQFAKVYKAVTSLCHIPPRPLDTTDTSSNIAFLEYCWDTLYMDIPYNCHFFYTDTIFGE